MNCPKCDGIMAPVVYHNIEVQRCRGCGGLWFGLGERERLAAEPGAAKAVDRGDPEVGRQHNEQAQVVCPACHTQMVKMVDHQQPHIWFESCNVCGGVFFDAGEFRDYTEHGVANFFRRFTTRERR